MYPGQVPMSRGLWRCWRGEGRPSSTILPNIQNPTLKQSRQTTVQYALCAACEYVLTGPSPSEQARLGMACYERAPASIPKTSRPANAHG